MNWYNFASRQNSQQNEQRNNRRVKENKIQPNKTVEKLKFTTLQLCKLNSSHSPEQKTLHFYYE